LSAVSTRTGEATMRVQIAARRCDVPETVQDRALARIPELTRFDPRISSAEVVFQEERHEKQVEAVLSVDRADPVVAQGEGADFREALDRMLDRLGRKLRRRRDRLRDLQGGR